MTADDRFYDRLIEVAAEGVVRSMSGHKKLVFELLRDGKLLPLSGGTIEALADLMVDGLVVENELPPKLTELAKRIVKKIQKDGTS